MGNAVAHTPDPSSAGSAGRFVAKLAASVIAASALAWAAVMIGWTQAGQPVIGMFSDSVWYLAIADYYRSLAGGDIPAHAQAAYDTSRFPPVYPMLIAGVGGGIRHQDVVNHLSIVLTIAAGMSLVVWVRSLGASTLVALAALPALYVTPALLDWLLIPLSEPLFLIGLLLALYAANRVRAGTCDIIVVASIVSLLPLIRSAGIVLVAAYALWALGIAGASRSRRALSIAVAAAPACLWSLYRSTKPVFLDYGSDVSLERMIQEGGTLAGFALGQITSLLNAIQLWFGASGLSLISAGIAVLGAAACHGWWLRLRNWELDAIFLPMYCGMLLVWPYPLEMPRLLGVIMPIATAWALISVSGWFSHSTTTLHLRAAVSVGAAGVVLALPAWAAMTERAMLPADDALEPYKRTPAYFSAGNESVALTGLETSARILAVIDESIGTVPDGDCVYTTQTALVMAASNGRLKTRPTPKINPNHPLAQQLAECRFLIVMQLGSRQAHAAPLYPLDEVNAAVVPLLASRQGQGPDAPIAAALLRFSGE